MNQSTFQIKAEAFVGRALKLRARFFFFSVGLVIISLLSLFIRNLNYAMDFTGGIALELSFQSPVAVSDVRQSLADTPYQKATIQTLGVHKDRILVQLQGERTEKDATTILALIEKHVQSAPKIEGKNTLGAAVGDELRTYGTIAFVVSLALISLYLSLRFQWRFALGAVLALLHDALIVLGVLSLFQIPFNLTALAAVLAVVGYSVNDTIVVYDRIREQFQTQSNASTEFNLQKAVLAVLGRTFITTGTTLLVTLALLIYAGESLFAFSLSLTVGVIVGTYSTTFVAIHILTLLKLERSHMVPDPKKRAKLDALP